MPYILKISPKAHEDIAKIHKYISKDGIKIADNQVRLIYNGLEQLAAQPEIDGELSKKFGIKTDYRFLVVNSLYIAFTNSKRIRALPRYIVFYTVVKNI